MSHFALAHFAQRVYNGTIVWARERTGEQTSCKHRKIVVRDHSTSGDVDCCTLAWLHRDVPAQSWVNFWKNIAENVPYAAWSYQRVPTVRPEDFLTRRCMRITAVMSHSVSYVININFYGVARFAHCLALPVPPYINSILCRLLLECAVDCAGITLWIVMQRWLWRTLDIVTNNHTMTNVITTTLICGGA